jgi:prophage regulatory protein
MQTNPPGNIDLPRVNRERLLRLAEVEQTVGIKKSAIYAKMNEAPPTFPLPVKLSRRAVAWPESAVQAWIQSQIAGAAK